MFVTSPPFSFRAVRPPEHETHISLWSVPWAARVDAETKNGSGILGFTVKHILPDPAPSVFFVWSPALHVKPPDEWVHQARGSTILKSNTIVRSAQSLSFPENAGVVAETDPKGDAKLNAEADIEGVGEEVIDADTAADDDGLADDDKLGDAEAGEDTETEADAEVVRVFWEVEGEDRGVSEYEVEGKGD